MFLQKKLSTESILALIAIFISTGSLVVYLYQATIMKEQQKASSWPYLEWLPSSGPHGLYLQIENKGTGPALIKNVNMRLNDKQVNTLDSLFYQLTDSTFEEYGYTTVNRRVISAGESFQPFFIENEETGKRILEAMKKNNFELEICYCSVYGDCWTCNGLEVKESLCD